MYCGNCGKQLPDGVKFCPACGAAQTVTAARPAQSVQPPAQAPAGKKPAGLILIAAVLAAAVLLGALVIAPNMGSPCEKAERQFHKINSFEDIIEKGPDIADLLLGMAQTDIDGAVFERLVANGPDYYYLPGHWYVEGKDVGLSMKCEAGRVASVEIAITGGGGLSGPALTGLRDEAVSAYGPDYEQTEWGGIYIHHTWAKTDLVFEMANDGTGIVYFRFT